MLAGLAVSLGLTGCGGQSNRVLVVGGVEDAAKWGNPLGKMELARRANFRAIVLSSVWTPPLSAPDGPELTRLRGAVDAAEEAGIRPIVAVYSFGDVTPLTPTRASRVRLLRRLDPARDPGDPRHERRQRAQLAALLEAPVRPRRLRRRRRRLPQAAVGDLRRPEGGRPEGGRDRRLARGPWQRQPARETADAFADRIHRGPRDRPPGKRARGSR